MAETDTGRWHRLDPADVPDEGRVRSVVVDGRTVALARCGGRLGALENQLPAPGRAARRGLDREGPAALPVARLRLRPDHRPAAGRLHRRRARRTRSRSATTACTCACPSVPQRLAPSPTSSSRRWSRSASTPCSAWSATPTSDSPTRCAAPRSAARSRYIGIRHEGAAAFAASAYGKLTGRPAACFAIAGPGSTNLLTGLYDAKLDGAPVIAISGQVPSKVLGRGAFQDLDLSAVFRDVAVSTTTVQRRQRPRRARRARGEARDRRARRRAPRAARRGAGAAVATRAAAYADRAAVRPADRDPTTPLWPARPTLVGDARRPVIIVGHGARGARGGG